MNHPDELMVAFFAGMVLPGLLRTAEVRIRQWRWNRQQRVARERMERCTHERTAFTTVPGPMDTDTECFRCVHCWAMFFPLGQKWVPSSQPPTAEEIARARQRGDDGE